jgi:hypothetical protein
MIASTAEAASRCFDSKTAKAAQLRVLKQVFDVAALSCPDTRDFPVQTRYNLFISTFQTVFVGNAKVLRAHFGGDSRLDTWMTDVANVAARRAATQPSYCGQAIGNLQRALAVSPTELESFAVALGPDDELVPVCRIRTAKAKRTSKIVHHPADKVSSAPVHPHPKDGAGSPG